MNKKCEACGDTGWILGNINEKLEIQRCDQCCIFEDDDRANEFLAIQFLILTKNLTTSFETILAQVNTTKKSKGKISAEDLLWNSILLDSITTMSELSLQIIENARYPIHGSQ